MARKDNQNKKNQASEPSHVPLAERMRPQAFDRFYGQEHLLGPGRILTELIDQASWSQ